MATLNFGGVEEQVITRDEYPLDKAREILKDEQSEIEARLRQLAADPGVDVVISTGGTRLLDGSWLRLPFRGWWSNGTGLDMEGNGAVPDHPVDRLAQRPCGIANPKRVEHRLTDRLDNQARAQGSRRVELVEDHGMLAGSCRQRRRSRSSRCSRRPTRSPHPASPPRPPSSPSPRRRRRRSSRWHPSSPGCCR